jgi:putative FmdB family regulatory protein
MPSYPYECPKCESQFDAYKGFDDIDRLEECPNCGMLLDKDCRKIARVYFTGEKPFDPYYCPGLGSVVTSKAERQRLAKSRGLQEVGNEPVENIHRHFDNERDRKCENRWKEFSEPVTIRSDDGGDPATTDSL